MSFEFNIIKSLFLSYYEDLIDRLDDEEYLTDLLKVSREIIGEGGKVILEIRYSNAKPDTVQVLSSPADIDEWQKKINETKERVKKVK